MEVDKKTELKTIKMEVDSDSEEKKVALPTICPESSTLPTVCPESSAESSSTDVKEDSKTDESCSDLKKDSEGRRSAEPERKDIIQLSVEGATEDENEKIIFMTVEQVKEYLLKKIGEYMNSPVNPLFNLRSRAKEVESSGKEQVEEFAKLYKGLQLLERKQEIFLRKVDILPKVTVSDVSVSARLPVQKPESLLKKELSITKVEVPPSNKPVSTSSNQTNSNAKPVEKPSNIECIDLTDDTEPPPSASAPKKIPFSSVTMQLKHPAPLPPRPFSTNVKLIPPRPRLKIFAEDRGIVLQWDMPPNMEGQIYDAIATFEIFGYQEQKNSVINTLLWKKIGSVKAMSLPMACTLTQFVDGNKYHFAIRAVDVHGRCGHYSDAISIVYKQKSSERK